MSKATDIQACIQANILGADEALMLDDRGYVKTCNSTNFMIVREGTGADEGRLVIWSPTKNNQMQGITRRRTLEVARAAGIPVYELDFSLTEVYGAVEVSGVTCPLETVRVVGTPGSRLTLGVLYGHIPGADAGIAG
jgi:branched-chain amino acid aminotransferase